MNKATEKTGIKQMLAEWQLTATNNRTGYVTEDSNSAGYLLASELKYISDSESLVNQLVAEKKFVCPLHTYTITGHVVVVKNSRLFSHKLGLIPTKVKALTENKVSVLEAAAIITTLCEIIIDGSTKCTDLRAKRLLEKCVDNVRDSVIGVDVALSIETNQIQRNKRKGAGKKV